MNKRIVLPAADLLPPTIIFQFIRIVNGLSNCCISIYMWKQFFQKKIYRTVNKTKDAMMIANAERETQAINDVWKRHMQIVRGEAVKKFFDLDFKE